MSTHQQTPRARATAFPHSLRRAEAGCFPEPRRRDRLTKAEAEDVLDWLEAHGLQGELVVDETGRFVVRCRR